MAAVGGKRRLSSTDAEIMARTVAVVGSGRCLDGLEEVRARVITARLGLPRCGLLRRGRGVSPRPASEQDL